MKILKLNAISPVADEVFKGYEYSDKAENHKSVVFHVDKHHHNIVSRVGVTLDYSILYKFTAEIECCFISVMTVRNKELLIFKCTLNKVSVCALFYFPKALCDAVGAGKLDFRGVFCQFRYFSGNLTAFVGIHRVYWAEIAESCAHKVEAVCFCL